MGEEGKRPEGWEGRGKGKGSTFSFSNRYICSLCVHQNAGLRSEIFSGLYSWTPMAGESLPPARPPIQPSVVCRGASARSSTIRDLYPHYLSSMYRE
jgi:hypothetical protein